MLSKPSLAVYVNICLIGLPNKNEQNTFTRKIFIENGSIIVLLKYALTYIICHDEVCFLRHHWL
jgi:hypothetical protein